MSTKDITSTISLLIETLGTGGKTAEDVSPYLKELFRKYSTQKQDKSGFVANAQHRGWTVVAPN